LKVNSNQKEILTRIKPDEVVKMLGVMFTTMGNEEAQTKHLWEIVDGWAEKIG
jgi:hypothetical protein